VYLTTIGGSGLLHLLAAYPRVIGAIGVTATVAILLSPYGPGQQIGTAKALAQLDRTIAARSETAPSAQRQAAVSAAEMLERANDSEIAAAVGEVLQHCGAGCTDLTSAAVISDPTLLRRVLVLQQLDKAAETASTVRSPRSAPETTVSTR
jgi:hypothetical protein